jgi:hypothetical protein
MDLIMAIWQFIVLLVWIWICTRRPEKTKAEKNREEVLDHLIKRANLYRIGQAMEEWGLFYPPGCEQKSIVGWLLEPEPKDEKR